VRISAAFEELAQWNLSTLKQLESAGQICLPNWILTGKTSRDVIGSDLGDHPDLGKQRELVPAPETSIRELIEVYRAAGTGLSWPAIEGEPLPGQPDVPGL